MCDRRNMFWDKSIGRTIVLQGCYYTYMQNYKDSNEFGNQFSIFISARMVHSAESTWTVLNYISEISVNTEYIINISKKQLILII